MFSDRNGTILSLLVAIFTIFYLGFDIKCATSIDSAYILKNLKSRLYGQDEAIKSIQKAIESRERIKIIVFIGGIGSGKTFASEIMSENVNNTYNFQRLVFQKTDDTKMNLNSRILKHCDYNMVVLDDLSVDDVGDSVYLLDYIYSKIDSETNKLDVVLIFNIEDIPEDTEKKINMLNIFEIINNQLQVLNLPVYMIEFKKLDESSIRKCVINSLIRASLQITEENIIKVMKSLGPDYSGCKEVYAKTSQI